jgi:hypothetical protein
MATLTLGLFVTSKATLAVPTVNDPVANDVVSDEILVIEPVVPDKAVAQ